MITIYKAKYWMRSSHLRQMTLVSYLVLYSIVGTGCTLAKSSQDDNQRFQASKAIADTLMLCYIHRCDSLRLDNVELCEAQIEEAAFNEIIVPHLMACDAHTRVEILSRPAVWHPMRLTARIKLIFIINIVITLLFMAITSPVPQQLPSGEPAWRYPPGCRVRLWGTRGIQQWFRLLTRDYAPYAYDVHDGVQHHGEYRGVIHWFRDASEKCLALMLVLGFSVYSAKAMDYFLSYNMGEAWRLVFIPLDINMGLAFAGWALIIDGFIHISAMVDAPGVSRTLDSLIVILAGFVVMLVEAAPGTSTLVSFTVGTPPWLAMGLALIISALFMTRSMVALIRIKTQRHREQK